MAEGEPFVEVVDVVVVVVTTTRVEGALFLDVVDVVVVVVVTTTRIEGVLFLGVVDVVVVVVTTTRAEGAAVVVSTIVDVETGTEGVPVLGLLLEEALAVGVENMIMVAEPILSGEWLGPRGCEQRPQGVASMSLSSAAPGPESSLQVP